MARKKQFSLAQVLVAVGLVYLVCMIVPSLLDAGSDVAVLIGVLIVVACFYGAVKFGKKVLEWLGFDFDEK